MKIIISPAKKMNVDTDTLACRSTPVFLEQTEQLLAWMRQLTFEQAKELWKCNDRIAEQNYRRFQEMNLNRNLTPAVIAYEGIQYQYMAPAVFGGSETDYIQEHLRILSGFYGVLKPFDGVVPYRLEMQAKASEEGDLYKFWGDRLYREVVYGEERAQEGDLKLYSQSGFQGVFQVCGKISDSGGHLSDGCIRRAGGWESEAERNPCKNGKGRDGTVSGGKCSGKSGENQGI